MAAAKISSEPGHTSEHQLGGGPRRSSSLRLIADEAGFRPDNMVPKTLAECPDTTVECCPHWRCRYHLFRVDGADRPGRPGLANVPRGKHGHTIASPGQAGTKRPPTTLDASAWIGPRPRPSCALALADESSRRGRGMGNPELALATGKHRTLSARVVANALRSFIAAGGDVAGLRELAAQSEARQANRSASDTPLLDRLRNEDRNEKEDS